MSFDLVEVIGAAVFAATGVLAVNRKDLDLFGALVLGVVTAIGGGTLRDAILDAPVFWLSHYHVLWVAAGASVVTFFLARHLRRTFVILLYLDAVGVALFSVAAVDKSLGLNFDGTVAVAMGVLTAIGGGLLRDVLAGRPTLLMSREIYATPMLLGCLLYVLLRHQWPDFSGSGAIVVPLMIAFRAAVIHWRLTMPDWLTTAHEEELPQ